MEAAAQEEPDEANFFLQGITEVDMDAEGHAADDEATRAQLQKQRERMTLEEEFGYFLQPLSVQRLDRKIMLYKDKVTELKSEFRARLESKRAIIAKMKHKQKELSIKDAAVVCQRCQSEVALLKTLKYIANDKHHAKCSFGFLRRVEIEAILKDENKIYLTDEANKGFVDCHMEQWKEEDPNYFSQQTDKKSTIE